MISSKKMIRIVMSSILLVAIIVTCAAIYQSGNDDSNKELAQAEESETEQEENQSTDAGSGSVEGEIETETEEDTQALDETSSETKEESQENAGTPEEASTAVENAVEEPTAPAINFTEESLMVWPISGDVLLDYSMDKTTYFPTLDVYKYNPAIVISSEVNAPVMAVANGQVVSIVSNEETGTTVTMDLGNGYQAVFGQLKEVAFAEGDVVESGSILGYVSEPTKYYSVEGSNLYFALSKDGVFLDPMMYLP
jgi:murein DD-endopeptidase MepM/ murein hydrolase activator NlpD